MPGSFSYILARIQDSCIKHSGFVKHMKEVEELAVTLR
jgi:hypothetical protein